MRFNTIGINKNEIVDLIVVLTVGLMTIFWFRGNFLIKAGDTFFSLSPSSDLMRYMYVWDSISATGSPNPRALTTIPYFFFMSFLQNIGFSLYTIQKIQIYVLFTLSGLSMYYLSSTLFNKNQRIITLTSSLFYMMNPYALTDVWGTGLWGIIFAYPLYPFMLALFIKGLNTGKYKYLLFILFSWLIFSVAANHPAFVISIWLLQFSYLIFFIFYNKQEKEKVVRGIQFTVLLLMFWLLTNIWWILPTLPFVKEEIVAAKLSGDPLNIFLDKSGYTSLLNVLRLLGAWQLYVRNPSGPYYSWSLAYFTIPFVVLSFLLPILGFVALLLKPKNRHVIYFTTLSVLVLFLLKGANFPLGIFNIWLFENIPFAGAFRSHYEKLGMILALSYAFLIGVALNELYLLVKNKALNRIKQESVKKSISATLVITILLLIEVIYVFPFWTGDVIYPGGNVIPSFRLQVPPYYHEASDWFKDQSGDFRIFYLPGLAPLGPAYSWEHGYFGSDPLDQYFFPDKGIIGFGLSRNTAVDDFQRKIINSLSENAPISVGKVLALANIRYVLLHNDFNLRYSPTTPPERFRIVLNDQKSIHFEKSFGQLDFYKNAFWKPLHIYATSNGIMVHRSLDDMIKVVERDDFLPGESVLFLSSQNDVHELSNIPLQIVEFNITLAVYDGSTNPANWTSIATEPYVAKYYSGWKGVISTDGNGDPDMLIFPSLNDSAYTFPPQSPDGWNAYNSTLVYLIADDNPREIYSIVTDGKPATDIVGVWWESDWMGMGTKPITYPIVIPPHQRAIIQINHKADTVNLLIEPPYFEISSVINKPSISYRKINPTKYIVRINASDPYFLVFSESYHKDWIAYVDGQQISNEYHFMANGYANAWYINKTGTYNITLEFQQQKLFYVGSATSIVTLIFCVLYISKNKIKALYSWHVKKKY